MPKIRLLAYVCGTVLTALGMGFFVQHGESAPKERISNTTTPVQQSVLKPVTLAETGDTLTLDLQDIQHTSATRVPPAAPANLAQGDIVLAALDATEPGLEQSQAAPQAGCDVALSATAAGMATVDLSVSAPCLGNERVTIHHNGMMFTDVTDADGGLTTNVPALAKTAVFIVQFSNGNGSVIVTKVPDLAEVDRVVLQWSGPEGFQIHAREFGAGYGERGHVWAGAPGGVEDSGF